MDKSVRFVLFFLLASGLTSLKISAQQYTANFATAPALSDPNGWSNQYLTVRSRATVTLNGVNYNIDMGQVASWTFNSSGGESNSSCISAPGYGTTSITISRADNAKFAFYGLWASYTNQSPTNYPVRNMVVTYTGATGETPVTYPANSTVVLSKSINVTNVELFCNGLDIMKLDNLIVGPQLPELATVSLTNPSIFNTNSATFSGNVSADGGATVTETGFVYNTTGTPTLSDNKVVVGNGTGVFTKDVTGLSPNTTYYVRSYATNSAGTKLSGTTGSTFTTASPFVLAGTHAFNSAWASTTNQASPFTKYVEGWNVTASATNSTNVNITRIAGTGTSTSSAGEGTASLRAQSVTTTEQLEYLGVKPANGVSFSMKSVKVRYSTRVTGSAFNTISVQGYKNGSAVSGALKSITGIPANTTSSNGYTLFDVSGNSKFDNIDEFKITASGATNSALLMSLDIDELVVQNVATNPLAASISSQTNVACFGGANGSATVTATGGTAPYTYSWAPMGGTAATATGLSAGVYTVTVTDASLATTTATATITQSAALVASASSQTNIACFGGSNGSATVNATGGTPTYTYSWAPLGGTAKTATGLAAGIYTVTVTDANGCTKTQNFTITQPASISTSVSSQTNVACNGGSNGSATIIAAGGAGSYTYSWAPSGGTAATATGLSAGSYTVTVTDANGCTKNQNVSITQPTAITVSSTSQTNVSCNGGSNGSATVNVTGGTGTYTYSWAPAGGTAKTATGLAAGIYTVTITDANGCTKTQNFTITQPAAITTSVSSQTNVACNGGSNGSATIIAAGGAGSYTYSWAPFGGTAATATGLSAGSYTVTVTDANGCTKNQNVTITQPVAIATSVSSQTNVSCNGGSNGSATVNVTGGTGTYTYSWAPAGGTAKTATGLAAGIYTVTVTDANGCTKTQNVTITQPAAITTSVSSQTNVACNGGSNGSATIIAAGGAGSYTYSWAPFGGTAATATGLSAGSYTVTVTDANSCTKTQNVTITQPVAIATSVSSQTNVSCNGGSNGSATVNVTGGTGSYTYSWAPAGGTAKTATGLAAGIYTVTVTDANGCTKTQNVTITQPAAIVANASSQTNVACNGGSNGSATVTVTGGAGSYTYLWAPGGGTTATKTGLSAGIYTVTVTDANGCTATKGFTITQPSAIVASTSQVNVSVNGGSNGSATVVATGGAGSYTYSWSPLGGTAATATGLSAGSYTVTITDANGCWINKTFSITEPAVSANADLSGLTLSTGSLNPLFAAATLSYSVSVGSSTSSVTITPAKADGNASIKINGTSVTTNYVQSLTYGVNTVSIVVTAQSGTTKTYTVIITRALPKPSTPALSSPSSQGFSDVTNDNTPTLTGTSVPGASITLYAGTTIVGTAVCNGSGIWSITASALADGYYDMSVKSSINGVENTSDTRKITVDTTAPAAISITRFSPTTAVTNMSQVVFQVVMSENVALQVSDFTVATTGSLSSANPTMPNSVGKTFYVTISGLEGSGTLKLTLKGSSTTIVDSAGNYLSAAFTTGEVYSVNVAPLAITLSDFNGTQKAAAIQLNWKAISDIAAGKFEIERSANGVVFTKVGEVATADNSSNLKAYAFTDEQPLKGDNYYRLKMTDKNNEVKYSPVIRVKTGEKAQLIKAVPNPVTNNVLNLQVANIKAGKYRLTMFDVNGQAVYNGSVTYNGTQPSVSVQLPATLGKGVYSLQLSNGTDAVKTSILIQ